MTKRRKENRGASIRRNEFQMNSKDGNVNDIHIPGLIFFFLKKMNHSDEFAVAFWRLPRLLRRPV